MTLIAGEDQSCCYPYLLSFCFFFSWFDWQFCILRDIGLSGFSVFMFSRIRCRDLKYKKLKKPLEQKKADI